MVLFHKLSNIDKIFSKKIINQKKSFSPKVKRPLNGYKKFEIVKMAQDNLYMLKRLNERTSFYNTKKLRKDYKTSQNYKKNHCLYPPIDFNKTFRYEHYNKNIILSRFKKHKKPIRNKLFSKTKYANMGKLNYTFYTKFRKKSKKRKRFEEFNYKDLKLDKINKSDCQIKEGNDNNKIFKKISDNMDKIKNIINGYKDKEIEKIKKQNEENENCGDKDFEIKRIKLIKKIKK